MNEDDPDWQRLRYLPMPKVSDEFLRELKITKASVESGASTAKANGKK